MDTVSYENIKNTNKLASVKKNTHAQNLKRPKPLAVRMLISVCFWLHSCVQDTQCRTVL